jgi:hypothetical protein
MENTMSNEANELLQKLLVSGIDAAGAHCVREPESDEPEPDESEPDDQSPMNPGPDDD